MTAASESRIAFTRDSDGDGAAEIHTIRADGTVS